MKSALLAFTALTLFASGAAADPVEAVADRAAAQAAPAAAEAAAANAPAYAEAAATAVGREAAQASLMQDLKVLSADDMKGRLVGTPESAKARAYIVKRLKDAGLAPTETPFVFERKGKEMAGTNVWAVIRGTAEPDKYVVVTAHYDHLGVKDGQIHNGADDNASGVAALFALAERFKAEPPRHSLLIVALDAEEGGLQGAKAFVANPPVDRAAMLLNVNLDMVARGDKGELYAAGTHHSPELKPVLDAVAKDAPVKLLLGHDRPEQGLNDWTSQSDHGAFHAIGVPFVYFGVEDHPDYHRPSDDFEKVNADFYGRSVQTIGDAIVALDKADAPLVEARANARPKPIKAGVLDTITGLGKWPVIGIAVLLGLALGLGFRFLLRKRG